MLIIVEIPFTDHCTFFCTGSIPIEYESLESAIVDFEVKNNEHLNNWKDRFEFGGSMIPVVERRDLEEVRFLTLEEWIENNKFIL